MESPLHNHGYFILAHTNHNGPTTTTNCTKSKIAGCRWEIASRRVLGWRAANIHKQGRDLQPLLLAESGFYQYASASTQTIFLNFVEFGLITDPLSLGCEYKWPWL